MGDRVLRLGYSGIGDYARERLGIAASTARKIARPLRGAPPARRAPGVHPRHWQGAPRTPLATGRSPGGGAALGDRNGGFSPVRTDPVRARYCEPRRTWV